MSPIGRRPMAAGSSKIGRQPWTGTMSQHARDDYEDDDEMISLSHTQTNKRQLIGGCSSTQTKNRSTTMSINRHEQQQQQQTPTRQSTRTNHNHHLHRHNSSRRTDARASIVSLWIIVALAFVSMDNVLAGDVKTTSPMTNNTLATNNTTSPAGQMRRTKSLAAGSGPQTDPLVNSKTAASSQQQLSNGFDQQSSELSSMYVQIPIAEPIEASASSTSSDSTSHYTSQQQATDEGDAPADSTKATTWTGPWPKKFQIGYIKQSDLHQVLMESLKGDPFLGSKKSAQNSAGQSSSSSSSSAQVGTKNSLAAPTQVPSLATKSAAGGLPAQMTTQEPGAPTKTASSGGDSLETLPQAPPSDASSLMQPGPYPKLNAVQQVSMSTGRLQQQHHNHQHQQSPLSSTRQYLQSQWPAVNSYGRLASPQVQPRPSAMGYMGKAGPMRQPAGMSHHNQHANQHQLPLLQQQHQQRNHHQSLAAGHHGQHQHHNQPNNFRHQHHARHANQQLHHHQQQQQQQAPFASLPIQVGGHHQQQQLGQNFKYGSIPMQQHQIQPGTFHQQVPSVASPSMGLLQGQQQLQFASGPSLTSQPMYSINSFPASQQQQQQTVMDGDQMELIQLTNGPAKQKSKSEYYLSSWRPVQTTSDDAKQQQQQQQIPASELGTDGFDEDFGSSAAPGSSSQNSMNRHPVLSNFLQSTSGGNGGQLADTTSAKTSPAKTLKQQQRQGTKSSTTTTSNASRQDSKGGSAPFAANKPVADTPAGQKGFDADSVQQRQEGTKSDTGRRALANGASGGDNNSTSGSMITTSMTGDSSTTTMPTTTTTTAATTTTGSSNGISAESGSSTTQATPTTTTTTTLSSAPGVNQTTTTMSSVQGAETTTEPDSEVFETDNTEAPGLDGGDEPTTTSSPVMPTTATSTTTTSSSMMPVSGSRSTSVAPTLQSPSSSTQSSVQQQQSTSADGGESEVVTQGNQQSVSSGTFPAVPQSLDESTTSSAGGQLGGGQSTTSSSSREETTPSSNGVSLGGGGAEVEGSSGGTSSTTTTQSTSSEATKTDASMSDEALMAAAVRANDQVTKSRAASRNSQRQSQQRQQKTNGQSTSGTKKARSSERIVQTGQQSAASGTKTVQRSQQQQQQQQTGNNKLITRKPNSQRAGKQISPTKGQTASISAGASKVASSSLVRDGKSAAQKSGQSASSTTGSATKTKKSTSKSAKLASVSAAAPKSSKFTRMAASSPNGSGQQTGVGQMVSMTAAQAQSAAQTLASLLLSRCLSSSNCSNLLDVCSTKQAAVPFGSSATNQQTTTTSTTTTTTSATTSDTAAAPINASIAAAWSMPVGLVSSNLMGLMQALQADKALQLFPAWREAIENVMDQEAPAGYTLVMPSNDAVDRMPLVQVDALLANSDQMNQLIDNHIIDSAEIIELGPGRGSSSSTSLATLRQRHQTRYIKSKGLQINQHRDRMVTINGKRVVYANQQAPGAGRIHVIDGLLDSPGQPLGQASSVASAPTGANNKLPDIMDTLRQCDKFDGFVTLAEGTGLAQILKQDEPLTVFVPSNEALRKIPDEELEVIKNNSTALRGRLVEANTSPMRRPDIVAKNGVIHILDWYLTTRDNEWCDPIGRSAANSDSSRGSSSQRDSFAASERVQQLASEQVVASISGPALSPSSTSTINLTGSSGNNNGYATRMTNLPANHKPAAAAPATNDMDTAASNNNLIEPTKLTSLISGQPTLLNSVYVSAMPMSSVTIETVQ